MNGKVETRSSHNFRGNKIHFKGPIPHFLTIYIYIYIYFNNPYLPISVFDGNLEQTGETMYITPDMINSSAIQMSDGSLYLTQDTEEQGEERGEYNTIYITPGELESAQRQTCQSAPIEEESNIIQADNSEVKVEDNCDLVSEPNEEKCDLESCKTLHVNVINMGEDTDEQTSQDSIINQNVASIVENSTDITNGKVLHH